MAVPEPHLEDGRPDKIISSKTEEIRVKRHHIVYDHVSTAKILLNYPDNNLKISIKSFAWLERKCWCVDESK